jgi:hypothetical protein
MYVRVTPLTFNPARKQELQRFVEERILPLTRQLSGFRRYTVALDDPSGRGVTLTEWDELQQAQEYRTAVASVLQGVTDLGVTLETSQVYEGLVQA